VDLGMELFIGPHILHCVGGPLDGDEYEVPQEDKPHNFFARHYHVKEFGSHPRLAWYTGGTWCGTRKGNVPGYDDLPIYLIEFVGETEIGCAIPPEETQTDVVEDKSFHYSWFENIKRFLHV
jgi:hypothetical protein